jgi:hypothetical protein
MTGNQRVKIFGKSLTMENQVNEFISNSSIKAINVSMTDGGVLVFYEEVNR